jgi:HD domain
MDTDVVTRPNRLTGPSILLGASALVLIGALALTTKAPDLETVLLFGALFAFAENVDVEGPSGAGLSAGLMVVVAAMVVFATDEAPLGAVLVGVFGALFLPHLTGREWDKVLYNAGVFAIAMGVGVGILLSFPQSWIDAFPQVLVAATLGALGYYVVDVACVSLAVARLRRRPVRDLVLTLVTSQWLVYPFAFLGAGLGWLELRHGAIPLVLTVTPILVGRQAFASYLRVREANEAALATLVQALESKDRYTAGHAARVAAYAGYMGEELDLAPRALERLRRAALMHDIGKLVVPNQLLNKPGRLTADEYERVRQHEEITVELLGRIDFLAPVAPIAIGVYAGPWDHDERHSPIERHIVAVADAYDAMTSTRAYRRALSQEVAFAELRSHSGSQFHPRCVEALIVAVERRGLHHGAGHESAEAVAEFAVAPPESGPGSAGLGDLAEGRTR